MGKKKDRLNAWEMSVIAAALRHYAKIDVGRSALFTIKMAEKFENASAVTISHENKE